MKPLRILYVVTCFPSVSETFIATQIAGMKELGHDCTIFSYQRSRDKVKHKIVLDFKLDLDVVYHFKNEDTFFKRVFGVLIFLIKHYKRLSIKKFISLLNPLRFRRNDTLRKAYWDMPIFLFNSSYDVIHCHFGFNAVKLTRAFQAGIVPKSRFVVSFHGSDLTPSKIPEYKELYKEMFAVFDAFTVNTPYLESLLRKVKPDLASVYVIPVGFHPDYLHPFLDLPKNDSVFQLVYCGRLMALKGPDVALKILYALHQKGYSSTRLMLIGEGEEEQRLRVLADTLGVASAISWIGSVSQEEVFRIMSTSHVFLYTGRVEEDTGRAETQGLVIQEAQYLKLPVVVADVGGVRYGLVDGFTGYLINSESILSFVEKILLLYHEPHTAFTLGNSGHHWVLSNFDCKSNVAKFEQLYLKKN